MDEQMNENKGTAKRRLESIHQAIHTYAKFAVVALLVAFMVFIVQSKDQFSEYVSKNVHESGLEYISLADGDNITQKFTAPADTIEELEFRIGRNFGDTRKGNLEFWITDSKGKVIYKITQSMDYVDGRVMTSGTMKRTELHEDRWYTMVVNQKINRGEEYEYHFKGVGIDKKTPLKIFISKDKGKIFGTCTKNGKANNIRLCGRIWTTQIDKWAIGLALAICVGLIILILLPVKVPEKWNKKLSWALFAVVPWVAFYMVEKIFYNPISVMNKWAFGLNILWYYAVFGLLLLIFNRTKYSIIVGTFILYLCGIADYAVLIFRGTPITPADFFALGTAMDVADHYTLTFNKAAIVGTVVMIGICIVAWKFDTFKATEGKKRRAMLLGIVAVWIAATTFFSTRTTFLENREVAVNFWNQKKGYKKNGYVLSFMMNIQYVLGTEPEGYSTAKVKSLTKNNTVTQGKNTKLTQKPNVVVIMNETLSDLSVVNDIKTNREVFPYLNSLKKNTIKGHTLMSVFGGGTSNSEYEFLTGNSISALPLSGNAYTQYVKHDTPSLASQLKEQGYETVAFHPYKASGWNRASVYPLLGFDSFLTMDDMSPTAEKLRGWYSDAADYDKIIETFENKKKNQPMFMFNVTIQNHGGYLLPDENFDEKVKITDEKKTETADRYESLMYESDQAFKKIVNYFSNQSEPTIVVMFGDHQPKLEDEFYELLYGKSLNSLSLEELQKRYITPFVIWANYDIEEQENVYTSVNYLSSMMLEQTNLLLTPYNQYLLEMAKEIPAINANGYVGADGKNYSLESDTKYSKQVNNYKILQYNSLFDYKNRDTKLFSTK